MAVKSWMIDLLKAATTQGRTPPEGVVADVEIPGGVDPADQAEANEMLAALCETYASLTPNQVQALQLAISEETPQSRQVASAAYRARLALKQAVA